MACAWVSFLQFHVVLYNPWKTYFFSLPPNTFKENRFSAPYSINALEEILQFSILVTTQLPHLLLWPAELKKTLKDIWSIFIDINSLR